MIETPHNVCFSNGVLRWSPVPYADGYNIHSGRTYIATAPGNLNTIWAALDPDETEYSVSAYVKKYGQECHTSKSEAAKPLFQPTGSLVTDDRFEDLDDWLPRFPYWDDPINQELQDYHADALVLDSDGLTINAWKGRDRWTSGIITGHIANSYTRGYFEADIKAPIAQGLWPAFWLLNTKYVGRRPEIDIMELVNGKVHNSYHWWQPSGNKRSNEYPEAATHDYHLYGMHWERNRLTWYIDRMPVYSIWGDYMPDQAMYPIINLAIGGNWPGDPDFETIEAEMKIRSFKVWQ